jgi:hypothetical protein
MFPEEQHGACCEDQVDDHLWTKRNDDHQENDHARSHGYGQRCKQYASNSRFQTADNTAAPTTRGACAEDDRCSASP